MAQSDERTTEQGERDLLDAVRKSLVDVGAMGHFKSELRASVMRILNQTTPPVAPVEVPSETVLLNELVREYLQWNGYIYTEQVLSAECGESDEKVRREDLSAKLGVVDDTKTQKIPLLYYILSAFKDQEQ